MGVKVDLSAVSWQLDLCGFFCILGNFVVCCRISPLIHLGGKYCHCFHRWPAFK